MLPDPRRHTIRPYGVCALHGLAVREFTPIAVDSRRGYLVEIDRATNNTRILNPNQTRDWLGTTGLALWEDTLWLSRDDSVYRCTWGNWQPDRFVSLPYPANGVAVWESTVYVTCQKSSYIWVFDARTGDEITKFYAPGVGVENLAVRDEELWVCDSTEQTVYCMDRATGQVRFSILTPFASPTGLTFYRDEDLGEEILYVAYSEEEPYIRDDPNSAHPHQLSFRDRTFIHPLHFHYNPEQHYTLSNGYLIEMSYVEEIDALDPVDLKNLEWRIGLPLDTPRQKVKHVEAIGLPFREEIEAGQRVAVFSFDKLDRHEAHLFGWKALLEVRGIKYHLTPKDVEGRPEMPQDLRDRYLVDNDNLAMDTEIVQRSAQNAIGSEMNLLRQVLQIRDYVYDRLDYGIKPHIDPPDEVLRRGVGSCGEYVGVLLALLRLNGIPCRTVGRYKCPPKAEYRHIPLEPDFNHVWMEFYIPGLGWVPVESNPDDLDRGPYPTRFFMGLAWYHIEITKDNKFEVLLRDGEPIPKTELSLGDLAINHVRFQILEELPPVGK